MSNSSSNELSSDTDFTESVNSLDTPTTTGTVDQLQRRLDRRDRLILRNQRRTDHWMHRERRYRDGYHRERKRYDELFDDYAKLGEASNTCLNHFNEANEKIARILGIDDTEIPGYSYADSRLLYDTMAKIYTDMEREFHHAHASMLRLTDASTLLIRESRAMGAAHEFMQHELGEANARITLHEAEIARLRRSEQRCRDHTNEGDCHRKFLMTLFPLEFSINSSTEVAEALIG